MSFPPKGKMDAVAGIHMLETNGFDAIDFTLNTFHELYGENWRREVTLVREALDRSDIVAVSAHLPFNGPQKSDMELLHRQVVDAIEMAGMLGVKRAVLHPLGSFESTRTEEEHTYWLEKNLAYYSVYLPLAEKAGIRLVTENMRNPRHSEGKHRYASNADELIELADALGLEVCWDFGHAHGAGLDQETELRKLGHRVTMLHVNDNSAVNDDHVPPYFGTADWKSAIRGLQAIGYRGHFNFELKFRRLPIDTIPAALGCVRAIGENMTAKIVQK
jgi:sugar phosphate isomerase/epimerase